MPAPPLPIDAQLRAHGVERAFARGEFVFHAGDEPAGLLRILEGRVRVINERQGRRYLVHEETTGASLGEVPLLLGGGYLASAIAATRVRCLLLPRRHFRAALAESPDLAWELLTRMAARVRTVVARLGQVSAIPVRQALAAIILERASGNTGAVSLAATQQELAESLGTVREVIARQLTSLRRAGAIRSVGRGQIAVANRQVLLDIVHSASV